MPSWSLEGTTLKVRDLFGSIMIWLLIISLYLVTVVAWEVGAVGRRSLNFLYLVNYTTNLQTHIYI
jgi:hypothetical protein